MKKIEVLSARENNLKDINVNIPINEITVVTGVSGSGKSSLVFDTVYAESERMFLESISTSMNGLTSQLKKPNVFKINNLLPAIAISQKYTNRNPRSTVGTATDIAKYIRLLFSKIASIDTDEIWVEGDFSYNNPKSWCQKCKGTGEEYIIDVDKLVDKRKSINQGAILYWNKTNDSDYYKKLITETSKYYNIDLDKPLIDLEKDKLEFILNGKSDVEFSIRYKNYKNRYRTKKVPFIGVYREISEVIEDIDKPSILKSIQKFLKKDKCSDCNGSRLKSELLKFEIYGKNIQYFNNLTVSELKLWLTENSRENEDLKDKVFVEVAQEVIRCIENLENVKLGYLSLDRSIPTLSSGEAQRLRLANQISCSLSGLLYVLDEPTMGLHVNDIKNIIFLINKLKEKGNTILMVEHNAEVMMKADNIIDIGPKGGIYGGYVIFNGSPIELIKNGQLSTANYLNNYRKNTINAEKINSNKYIRIQSATYNNIDRQNFIVPLNQLVCITGVSGSGKSTFVEDILEPSISKKYNVNCCSIEGIENISKVIKVEQSPIGRSPKSNVATYTGLFDIIRDIFASTDEAKKSNLNKSYFSFNIEGGRCDNCKGDGILKIDMSFMGDTYIECNVCEGKRYKQNILGIKYNEKNIYDVLNMTVIEAYEFLKLNKKASNILKCLIDVGLDYIKIGQSALTISGGEAQRIKLAKYLSEKNLKNIVYILDEPSSGLHNEDTKKLINLLKDIVKSGNTVVVVEHNPEVIRSSNYIIDMGNEGGASGGKVIDMGTINEIKRNNLASICNIL
ncbi:excinuclease ABC subunit UvrA [Paraclostridium sordellii]|uniref:excinuclease ABC subunit UvrA n=1 Tax=Paraclostridium sordellii TaxID=1505 RepID=UPI0005DD728F|nr:excinuclease ABC subunit UvrA [Paeniclostridium sordellii]CEN80703.1 excinuclease ABC subunit A [[Clostridium] sordellii] [Paeniclostridium sordellii]